jgi:hypothetical protein
LATLLLGAVIAVAAGAALVAARAVRSQAAALQALREEVRALSGRLDALEVETARVTLRADVAEAVLVEKGVADEEDLEEARRSFEEEYVPPRHDRERDGNLQ